MEAGEPKWHDLRKSMNFRALMALLRAAGPARLFLEGPVELELGVE
jgi:hypothetical protein